MKAPLGHAARLCAWAIPAAMLCAAMAPAQNILGSGLQIFNGTDRTAHITSAGLVSSEGGLATTGTLSLPNSSVTDAMVSDTITVGSGGTVNDAALSSNVAHLNANETISANWTNTSNPWADNEVQNNLTIQEGSIDATPIGAGTPDTGAFTTLSATGNVTAGNSSADDTFTGTFRGSITGALRMNSSGGPAPWRASSLVFGDGSTLGNGAPIFIDADDYAPNGQTGTFIVNNWSSSGATRFLVENTDSAQAALVGVEDRAVLWGGPNPALILSNTPLNPTAMELGNSDGTADLHLSVMGDDIADIHTPSGGLRIGYRSSGSYDPPLTLYGPLRMYEGNSEDGNHYTGFVAPWSLPDTQMYTLPSDTPSETQVLTWNTGGLLSWETPAGGLEADTLEDVLGRGNVASTHMHIQELPSGVDPVAPIAQVEITGSLDSALTGTPSNIPVPMALRVRGSQGGIGSGDLFSGGQGASIELISGAGGPAFTEGDPAPGGDGGTIRIQGGAGGTGFGEADGAIGTVIVQADGGRTGIGTASPSATLDVSGEIRSSSAASGEIAFAQLGASGANEGTRDSTITMEMDNRSGSSITGGLAVESAGGSSAGDAREIALYNQSSDGGPAVVGVAQSTIADGAVGDVIVFGIASMTCTGTIAVGEPLYVNASGQGVGAYSFTTAANGLTPFVPLVDKHASGLTFDFGRIALVGHALQSQASGTGTLRVFVNPHVVPYAGAGEI